MLIGDWCCNHAVPPLQTLSDKHVWLQSLGKSVTGLSLCQTSDARCGSGRGHENTEGVMEAALGKQEKARKHGAAGKEGGDGGGEIDPDGGPGDNKVPGMKMNRLVDRSAARPARHKSRFCLKTRNLLRNICKACFDFLPLPVPYSCQWEGADPQNFSKARKMKLNPWGSYSAFCSKDEGGRGKREKKETLKALAWNWMALLLLLS